MGKQTDETAKMIKTDFIKNPTKTTPYWISVSIYAENYGLGKVTLRSAVFVQMVLLA